MSGKTPASNNPAIQQYYAAHLKRVARAAQQEGGLDRGMILSLVFYALDGSQLDAEQEQTAS